MNNKIRNLLTTNEIIVAYIIIGLSILIGCVNAAFFGVPTLVSLSRSMLVILIFAICEMVVIISGGIDVSFPAIACISLYATIRFMLVAGIDSPLFAFVMAAVIGILFGALNAYLIAKMKMPPLIATLGVSSVVSGGTLAFLGTKEISNIPDNVDKLSQVFIFTYTNTQGIRYSLTILFIIPVVVCIGAYIILKYTMLGRGIYAIGGDKNAARIAGFNVTKIQFIVYMTVGCLAGIGGITYMILMRQASPQVLMGSEMMVIAAVVIGGTRITGGHGSVLGTILGVGLITLVRNNLIMLGVPTHFQTLVVGLIIVIGTSITSLRAKKIANSAKV
ncbi:ABC transporter permease [Cellulosilyticum sp. I15G10I2]|uniref:ABC transporter permease n=1 Tax=Cellulosilyticum sp. I15G10I2 TaxID=1892843 RepID=UPI00085CA700|nr:ABC transporter permease [Cellulosilyticum sp. I15G10I2]